MKIISVLCIALSIVLLAQSAPPVERPKENESEGTKLKADGQDGAKIKVKITTKKVDEPPNLLLPNNAAEKGTTTKGVKVQNEEKVAGKTQGTSTGSTLSRALQSTVASGSARVGSIDNKGAKSKVEIKVVKEKLKEAEKNSNAEIDDKDDDVEDAGKGLEDLKKPEKLPKSVEAEANKVLESPPQVDKQDGRQPRPPTYVSDEHGSSAFHYIILIFVVGIICYIYRKKLFTMVSSYRRGGPRRNVRYRKLSTGDTVED